MKKSSVKKIFTLITVIVIIVCTTVFAAAKFNWFSKEDDTMNYVAFGDSISSGYGLKNIEDGYVSLIGKELQADNVLNYSVKGMNSSELLTKLSSGDYDEDIKNADVITLSIGSNDLLLPFVDTVMDSLELDIDAKATSDENVNFNEIVLEQLKEKYGNNPTSLALALLGLINDINSSTVLDNNISEFKNETFPAIIDEIKDINKDAKIIVSNVYNPFYGVSATSAFDVGKFTDGYIKKINEAFVQCDDYDIADVYSAFNVSGLTNVNVNISDLSSLSVDPHPNVQGHTVIFKTMKQYLPETK